MPPQQNPPTTRFGEYADEQDAAAFWEAASPRREPLQRRWFLPVIFALVVLSIPWYLPASLVAGLVFGLPIWTWIAVICSAGIAVVTSWVSLRDWDDDVDAE